MNCARLSNRLTKHSGIFTYEKQNEKNPPKKTKNPTIIPLRMSQRNNLLCLYVCFVVLVINKWMLSVARRVYSVGSICLPQQAVNTAGRHPTLRMSRLCLPAVKLFAYDYKHDSRVKKHITSCVLFSCLSVCIKSWNWEIRSQNSNNELEVWWYLKN